MQVGKTDGVAAGRVRARLRDAPEPPNWCACSAAFDPYLQARDRELIVPDKVAHKALWPVLGRPGAVFVDGEVARHVASEDVGQEARRSRSTSSRRCRAKQVEVEAERVAEVRGLTLDRVK